MNRRRVLTLATVLLLTGLALWWAAMRHPAADKARDAMRALEGLDVKAELDAQLGGNGTGVDLSLKGIELSQGEAGVTEWRLTADRARYLEEEGTVEVEAPAIVYYLGEAREPMRVTAAKGLVRQAQKEAGLWPDVTADIGDSRILAGRLDYDGAARRIRLSEGVSLAGRGFNCTAREMRLDLDGGELLATGRVRAHITRLASPGDHATTPGTAPGIARSRDNAL